MVFGWGKKKNETAEAPITEKSIDLENVLSILEKIRREKITFKLNEAKLAKKQIVACYDELKNLTKQLEKDDLKTEDIDKNLRIIVVRGRDQVISVMEKEIPKDIPQFDSPDDLEKIVKDLSQRLKVIGDVLGRQTRVIHIFAKKYADKLKEVLEIITLETDNLSKYALALKNLDSKISEIKSKYDEITTIQNTKKQKTTRIAELSESLLKIDDKISEEQSKRSSLLASKEFLEYQKIMDSINDFELTKTPIIESINQQFTKISRPLGRYSHGSLDKSQQDIYDTLMSSPFDVLKRGNKEALIVILDGVRKGIESGSISVKDIQKSIIQVNETIEMLDAFIDRVDEFHAKHQSLISKLRIFNRDKLSETEDLLKKLTEDGDDLKSKIHMLKSEIVSEEEKVPRLVREIETSLNSLSSTKYLLNYE